MKSYSGPLKLEVEKLLLVAVILYNSVFLDN